MSQADLIARLEKLEGPDLAVDETIARLTGWSPTGGVPAAGAPSHWYSPAFGMPAFTASLDAAVALVERVLPGKTVLIGWGQTEQTVPWARVGPWSEPDATGGTPAIALLIATLKALQENSNG